MQWTVWQNIRDHQQGRILPAEPGGLFPLRTLQAKPFKKLHADSLAREEQQEREAQWLRCRFCLHPITDPATGFTRDGSHLQTHSNPAGLVFTIGLFNEAPGCTVSGIPTTDYSWYAGYGWQIASCCNCFSHLGWRFSTPQGDGFFGLIVENLVDG